LLTFYVVSSVTFSDFPRFLKLCSLFFANPFEHSPTEEFSTLIGIS
jgi:hypothetical protein